MTTTKMTNRVALTAAIEALGDSNPEAVAKLSKMIEQLTAQQTKNEGIKGDILAFLADNSDSGFTVSDLLKSIPSLEGDSNQHVSALMRALVLDGRVTKYSEKRRTYFKIAE